MNTTSELRLEDEREWFSQLVNSDGWKRFVFVHKPLLEAEARKIRAEDCLNRDWHAGVVTAYEKLLRYPEARIQQINVELAKRK